MTSPDQTCQSQAQWQRVVKEFQKSNVSSGLIQLANTVVPYALLWYAMYLSLSASYALTLLLAIPAGGVLIRLFIIFHDCGHGSFFKSQKINDFVGVMSGIMLLTPYYHWRHEHAVHHASAGNLDRRGVGDVWTMTVKEYRAASRWIRLKYRVYRNPFIFFLIGPLILFFIFERFPMKSTGVRERHSVYATNLALAGMTGIMCLLVGWKAFFMIQFPIYCITAASGVWMFYIQHQFEDVYWDKSKDWDYARVAFEGSSFYKLPKILQWFTGNIGFHHVHHLSPRIPNYLLQKCHESHKIFTDVKPIGLWESLKSVRYRLWDEEHRKMVGFKYVRQVTG